MKSPPNSAEIKSIGNPSQSMLIFIFNPIYANGSTIRSNLSINNEHKHSLSSSRCFHRQVTRSAWKSDRLEGNNLRRFIRWPKRRCVSSIDIGMEIDRNMNDVDEDEDDRTQGSWRGKGRRRFVLFNVTPNPGL